MKVIKKQLTSSLKIEFNPVKDPSKLTVVAYVKNKESAWLTFDVDGQQVILDSYTGWLSVHDTLRVIKATEKYIKSIVKDYH